MYLRFCLECDKEFETSDFKRTKFCSVLCRHRYQYKHNSEKHRNYKKQRRMTMRDIIFSKYGDFCVICHEKHKEFLCCDHINDDGNIYRSEHGTGSNSIYCFLNKNNWPNNVVQILCHNCNFRKQRKRYLLNSYTSDRHDRVILKYGGKCVCCGETDLDVLQLDHINNNGAKECRQLGYGNKNQGRQTLFRKLDRETPMNGYRILCANCNLSLGFYGYCPHGDIPIPNYEKQNTKCLYCDEIFIKKQTRSLFCCQYCSNKYRRSNKT